LGGQRALKQEQEQEEGVAKDFHRDC